MLGVEDLNLFSRLQTVYIGALSGAVWFDFSCLKSLLNVEMFLLTPHTRFILN